MGHRRLGELPRTKKWSGIFDQLQAESISPSGLSSAIAKAAHEQLSELKGNIGLNYCFWILVRLVTAARGRDFSGALERLGISSRNINSGLTFVKEVARTVEIGVRNRAESTVFVQMAELSLREVLSANIIEQSRSLFGTNLEDIQAACRIISTRDRFGESAKDFFANFTSRSICYLLDKELSNHVGPDGPLNSPTQAIKLQNDISRYCKETSRIVEEFAGGWFSKQNWETNNNISEEATIGFTAFAIEKIQMGLREGQQ